MLNCSFRFIKNFFIIILLIFQMISGSSLFAQSKKEIARMELVAREHFRNSHFHQALPIFIELDSIDPTNPHYIYPIGICYLNSHAENKAIPYFERCLKEPQKYPAKLHYYTGKAYHLAHHFDEAIRNYEKYIEVLSAAKKKKDIKTIKAIEREMEMCRNGKELIQHPVKVDIVNLGEIINSPWPDYGPVISADESVIIFTSGRPGTTGGMKDPFDGHFYDDIYISYKTDSGWTKPVGMGDSINTAGHDASIALSADGQKLLLYRYESNNYGITSSGNLYMSQLRGSKWGKAKRLPAPVNSGGWEPSASLSADERIIFFTSDREGGYGGTDLYMSRKLPNGEWALPMNLGPKINTPYDEDAPFIHPDGKTLYFSSKGHKSMGGFDIFFSEYDSEKKEWSEPRNVGYPLSTSHDDIHFSWTASGQKVYFSSVRPEGQGDRDIYYAVVEKEAANLVLLKGIITDSLTMSPMEAKITVTDNNTNELIGVFNSNSETGKYVVILPEGKLYRFYVEAEEYQFSQEIVNTIEMTNFEEFTRNIRLTPKNR